MKFWFLWILSLLDSHSRNIYNTVPVVLPGVATAAGNAQGARQGRGSSKQPSVRWKSKGQNTELWSAGPALLLALCKPAGPWAPAGMGKGRVHGLHPRNLVGCMDLKTRWPPRRKRREEGTLLPFHGRICGCPAAWDFSWGPCEIKVWCVGTE